MSATDLPFLDSETILVRSSRDHRNPPTAARGTLKIKSSGSGEPEVSVVVDFPEMFTAPAHQAVIPLNRAARSRLKRHPDNGQLECTVDYDFVRETQKRSRVLPRAQGGQPMPQSYPDRPPNPTR
jgi:hypothetical protein